MLKRLGHMFRRLPTCRDVAAFLTDYVEGRLSDKTAKRFEAHISMCSNCTRYLEQYRTTIQLLKESPPPKPPPELADKTCEFLRNALDKGPS